MGWVAAPKKARINWSTIILTLVLQSRQDGLTVLSAGLANQKPKASRKGVSQSAKSRVRAQCWQRTVV